MKPSVSGLMRASSGIQITPCAFVVNGTGTHKNTTKITPKPVAISMVALARLDPAGAELTMF